MLDLFTFLFVPIFLTIMIVILLLALLFWSWELLVFGITFGVMAFMTLWVNYQFNKPYVYCEKEQSK